MARLYSQFRMQHIFAAIINGCCLSSLYRQTTTVDNGGKKYTSETERRALPYNLLADPYSSWQRGTNEYTNGLLHTVFPNALTFAL